MIEQVLTLELAANPSLLSVARVFAAAAARAAGCDDEAVEDVRLAASEACTGAIRRGGDDDRIELEAAIASDRLDVTVRGTDRPDGSSRDPVDDLPDVDLVRALFPDVTEEHAGGHRVVRFGCARA